MARPGPLIFKFLGVGVVALALIAYLLSPAAQDVSGLGVCRQLYAKAWSRADTLRIDGLVPLQRGRGQLTVMTCGALRGAYPKGSPWTTASRPAGLSEADLSVGGMPWIPDTAVARRILGAPTIVRRHDDLVDDELLHLTEWEYPGLLLTFSDNGRLRMARITGGAWTTHRGLQVGDPSERVLSLYGPPQGAVATEYLYQLPGDERPSRLGLFAMFENGRVKTIGIGLIVEGD